MWHDLRAKSFVYLHSTDGECSLCNPWLDATVTLYYDGEMVEDLMGEMPVFPIHRGETTVVVPKRSALSPGRVL